MEFGVRELDGDGFSQMVQAATDFQKRNYVAMEVKKNLSAEERQTMLKKFDSQNYKKVAVVVVGEPPKEFKAKTHEHMLAEKRKPIAAEVTQKRQAADKAKAAERAKVAKEKAAERAKARKEQREREKEAGLEVDEDNEDDENDDAAMEED